jgi:CHAT domain-containing protein
VVLLIFYILLDTDIKLVSTILTSESTTLVDQPLQDPAVLYRLDPALQPLNILGVKTLTLRDAIQRDPGSVCVASPAEEILRDWPNWALGPAKEILSDLHAKGYHRLFIVPDGPLHVFPFHLIGPIGQPLCGDWLVSYLPTPSILGSSTAGRSRPRRAGVDAFGIDFIGFPVEGWDELPEAISEAKSIAASAPGGRAVLNAQATRRAVADALEGAQWVHLGTHGTANAVAPAFNSLVLWPDSGDDGRLAIYDMLSLDLRGLELVTLSACNTALGRFDVADNVRSIPATLLLLGAKAVVSTLWPAETKSCATFFTSLYRVLGEGKSVDRAFLSAQEITRAAHPDYRDWGTFVLAG